MTRPPRPRRWRFLVLAVPLLVIGAASLAAVIVVALGVGIARSAEPITEFNPALDHTFRVPDADRRYVLSAIVPRPTTPPPEASFTFTTAEGEPVQTTPRSGYATVFGRSQRAIFTFDTPPGVQEFIIRAEADPASRFIVNRDPNAIGDDIEKWAVPGLVLSGVCSLAGLLALLAFFVATPERPDLDPE